MKPIILVNRYHALDKLWAELDYRYERLLAYVDFHFNRLDHE